MIMPDDVPESELADEAPLADMVAAPPPRVGVPESSLYAGCAQVIAPVVADARKYEAFVGVPDAGASPAVPLARVGTGVGVAVR